ncbi:malonyl-CoA:anthocyanidin 5-O-glucoside-6''-O-malonyltransferase [Arachis ipaensis]|uniref:malonyl-CoA:anthocyanidin 5-O-glucoside-6''-O-malonyltransferase n=1 Tax=Arachis ipaensis TaxID=130454 RepID=UPI0007AFC912|nr:malonyl-CoA:anthocyanidin 5-O-glucoside-6''-O-malonyltransferase [Arachis ipaensis]
MASSANNNTSAIKIHEKCLVPPPNSSPQLSLPLTFFDLMWLRFHPVERIFFYSLPTPHSTLDSLLHQVLPTLKNSLSLTLQHFLPLAGTIVWPSDSNKPLIQYNVGDGVSLTVAESTEDLNHFLVNSPVEALDSRSLVPHLESSDSHASIGISSHHAVLDGKSSIMFVKAWAYLCREGQLSNEESPRLAPELVPIFDKEAIKDPNGRGIMFINNWKQISSQLDPNNNDSSKGRTLKIMSAAFPPLVDDRVRSTFELTRGDLEKIRNRVLSNWDTTVDDSSTKQQPKLSTFLLTCAYVSVCIVKATDEESKERGNNNENKFMFGFTVDCRAKLDPPVHENYFGNCVAGHIVDAIKAEDFREENALVIVAKNIYNKIRSVGTMEGALDGIETMFFRAAMMVIEGKKALGVAGSARFGVYGIDFGWGKPEKVEITSVDRGITIGMAESKDGSGGIQVGLVLNKHVMHLFNELFHAGLY